MTRKRSSRTILLASACIASLGLIVGVSPAAAKKKPKFKFTTVVQSATASQCINVNSPIASENGAPGVGAPFAAFAGIPITIPPYLGLPQDGWVTAVNSVGVRITHTFDRDLSVLLVAPGSRVVPLALSRGFQGDGYGTGAKDCTGNLVTFGDGFDTPISSPGNGSGNNPINGAFRPELPLSSFNGTTARGTWELVVTDGASGDDGSLDAFQLSVTYDYLAQVPVPVKHRHKKK